MLNFGFYNSKNEDRKYNASHFGKIFDGVIQDGVFAAIKATDKTPFQVDPTSPASLSVIVNKGKAWLAHTWNTLDGTETLTFEQVNVPSQKRTDAICIQINASYAAESGFEPRSNEIVIVRGQPTSEGATDLKPDLSTYQKKNSANDVIIWRYPIAYVTIYGRDYPSGSGATVQYHGNVIEAVNIESAIEPLSAASADKYKTWTPLVTGATLDATDYIPSASEFSNAYQAMMNNDQAAFNTWFTDMKNTIIIDQSAQAALAQLDLKIDNKILYGTEPPSSTLANGQVYFQIEE